MRAGRERAQPLLCSRRALRARAPLLLLLLLMHAAGRKRDAWCAAAGCFVGSDRGRAGGVLVRSLMDSSMICGLTSK
jgi:hypothetical protein